MTTVQVDNNTSTAIPDNDPDGATVTYVVSGADEGVVGVRLSLYLAHGFSGDLTIDLEHPDGTTVRLFNQVNGGDGDIGTSSSQADRAMFSSSYPIQPCIDTQASPFVGTWSPSTADMNRAFAGKSANGTWTLTIIDHSATDTGSHENSSLFIDINDDDSSTVDSGLEWHITGLWYPGETEVVYYGRISDPTNGQVTIPLNDSRRAQVTVSTFDPIVRDALWDDTNKRFYTYARFLKVYYRKKLVFWGPWKLAEGDLNGDALTLYAVDESLRLIRHFLRRGDQGDTELSQENDDKALYPVDYLGIRYLRDAGLNTTDQTDRGVPDLGIADGVNDAATNPSVQMGVSRGDQVWNTIKQLSDEEDGPDFELQPMDSVVGYYAQLNTYESQGFDISKRVALHYGTGKANVENLTFTCGEEYTTHVHVLPRDAESSELRVTSANAESSAETGPYVDWLATDYDANAVFNGADVSPWQIALDALSAYGESIIKNYGRPLLAVTLQLPVETETSYEYGVDYGVGDVPSTAGRKGFIDIGAGDHRIMEVRLNQADNSNRVRPEIDITPDLVGHLGDSIAAED